MHSPDLAPALTPAVALAVYAVRRGLPMLRRRLPDWTVPLVAAVLGALASAWGLDGAALDGAVAGLAGTGLHQVGAQAARARRLRRVGDRCGSCGRQVHISGPHPLPRVEAP